MKYIHNRGSFREVRSLEGSEISTLTRIENIGTPEIKSRVLNGGFCALRLDTRFDPDHLCQGLDETLVKWELLPTDKDNRQQGIGLQYENENDPLYDAVRGTSFHPDPDGNGVSRNPFRIFHKINEVGERFRFVFEKFHEIRLYGGRLSLIAPGMSANLIRESASAITLYVPIRSVSGNFLMINGKRLEPMADGSSYLINTTLPHSVQNRSDKNCSYLTFNLTYLSFVPVSNERMRKFYQFQQSLNESEARRFTAVCQLVKKRDGHHCLYCDESCPDLFVVFLPPHFRSASLQDPNLEDKAFSLCGNCYFGPGGLIHATDATDENRESRILEWLRRRTSPRMLPLCIESRYWVNGSWGEIPDQEQR